MEGKFEAEVRKREAFPTFDVRCSLKSRYGKLFTSSSEFCAVTLECCGAAKANINNFLLETSSGMLKSVSGVIVDEG